MTKGKKKILHRFLSLVLCMAMVLTLMPMPTTVQAASKKACVENNCSGTYTNGFCSANTGHYEEPVLNSKNYYELANAGNLYWFAQKVNSGSRTANAMLIANIVVNEGNVADCNGIKAEGWREWSAIGPTYPTAFQGTFDGQGFSISGLFGSNTKGFFGTVVGGTIKNVIVCNTYFQSSNIVGGICANMQFNGNIVNCVFQGTLKYVSTSNLICSVGGICGSIVKSKISNCYAEGRLINEKYSYMGGILGSNNTSSAYSVPLENCASSFFFEGNTENAGGLIGSSKNETIKNCYYDNTKFTGGAGASNVTGKPTTEFTNGTLCNTLGHKYQIIEENTQHYKKCMLCGSTTEKEKHGYTNVCDTHCNTCGFFRDVTHQAKTQATCTASAVCANCNQSFGTKNPENHTTSAQYVFLDTSQHEKKYLCCGKVLETANHSYVDDCCICGDAKEATAVDGVYQITKLSDLVWFANQVNTGNTTMQGNRIKNQVHISSFLRYNKEKVVIL